MDAPNPRGGGGGSLFRSHLCRLLAFLPVFFLLLLLAIFKAIIIGPLAFLIILAGNLALICGLYPLHVIWTCYCILRTKRFGELLKAIILLLAPLLFLLWLPAATIGSVLTGIVFGIIFPLMATFEAVREGVNDELVSCLKDGTWSSIEVAFKVVRDFKDICFHSYFSVMDGVLESQGETLMDIKLSQVPGCALAGILGLLVDVPVFILIITYKVPVMLYKGWRQLIQDLIGRSGPFLESICVPFAGLVILLWPLVVVVAAAAGILSSFGLGLYASAVTYQENSAFCGILYVIAIISIFDEYTNDILYLREGSCFPRPRYRKSELSRSPSLPIIRSEEPFSFTSLKRPLLKTPSLKMQELKAVVIWEEFLKACENMGKDLIKDGAILISDLDAWLNSKNRIVNIGLPSCVFLYGFIQSIKRGSTGFIMRDNIEVTSINRPEGRIFDWLFEPMLIMKEQIRAAALTEAEEAYLFKLALYCGDTQRLTAWLNGGVPLADKVKKAQLEGITRRLHGFCLTLSRMPTYRRRFEEVVKVLLQEARKTLEHNDADTVRLN